MKENIHFDSYVNKRGETVVERTYDTDFNTRGSSRSHSKSAFGILGIILLLLLIVAVFRALNNSSGNLTFTGFLEWIGGYKPIFENVSYVSNTLVGDWGLFDFLRNFFNLFIDVFDFAVYIAKSMMNLVSYIVGIVQFFFTA